MPRGGHTSGTRHGNGAGQGDGWGGAAKGVPEQAPRAEPFQPGNDGNVEARSTPEAEARRLSNAEKSENIRIMLYVTAMADPATVRPETKITAGKAFHEIINGQPVARNVNTTVDDVSQLSDDAIREELARGGGTRTASASRDASPSVPDGSDDLGD